MKRAQYLNNNYIEDESIRDTDKILSIKGYLDMMIKPYLSDIINNYQTQGEWIINSDNTVIDDKTQGEWKTQSTMQLILYLLRMHTKIYILEIMIDNETDEIIEKLFESYLQRYKKDLEERMRGSESVFDSVDLLHYEMVKK